MKKLLAILLSSLMVVSVPVWAEEEAPAETSGLAKDVCILYTSDVHCGVDQHFGYVGLKAVYDTMAKDNYVLLVDDGDSIQGEPLGTVTRGEADIDLMNAIGYDVAIPGNHEFDYGMDRFLELTEMAEFPYISCNFNKEGELIFDPYVIKEFDGVKIAFVGVTTPKTLVSSTPSYFQDEEGNFIYGFMQDETGQALYDAVQKAVDDARAEGAQYVIVMAHLGNEAECIPWTYADVIENTNGIDVFLDGHSHDTDQVVVKNKDGEDVIRSACGTKLSGIGWVDIPMDPAESITAGLYSWNNDVPLPDLLGIENEMTAAVEEATAELGEKLAEVVATTPVDLYIHDPEAVDGEGQPIRIVRTAETNLGDLCADAFRDQGQADIGFVNGGGVRVPIPTGDITVESIMKVHPFGNELCVVEVTGQQILDALEWSVHASPGEFGGFLQVSGLTFTYRNDIESPCSQDDNSMMTGIEGERRVQEVLVGGEPLDPEKTYTVAGTNYLLKENGDGYTAFDGATLLQDSVKIDNQVLIDYITETLGGVIDEKYADPYGEGRIVALVEDEETVEAEE